MIIKCKECGLMISSDAVFCPHCGYVYKPDKMPKPKKRSRLPNGFGQITFIGKKNLRNPYRVMVTVGKTEYGKPIQKLLKPVAYFKTYNEAYNALLENAKSPYDKLKEITLKELYDEWLAYFSTKKVSKSVIKQYKFGWNHMSYLGNKRLLDMRIKDIKDCINLDTETKSLPKVKKIVFNKLYDYAIDIGVTDKNLARMITETPDVEKQNHHITFTNEEISILFKNKSNIYVAWILIQCYTGLRPNELCQLKLENIFLDKNYFVGGSKTKAGINRKVPIHPCIKDLFEKQYHYAKSTGSEYFLINANKNSIVYNTYRVIFKNICNEYELSYEHRAHDCRKFFITEAKKYNVDEYAIKLIVGHTISDITESVYTERSIEWLLEEISKIKPVYEIIC